MQNSDITTGQPDPEVEESASDEDEAMKRIKEQIEKQKAAHDENMKEWIEKAKKIMQCFEDAKKNQLISIDDENNVSLNTANILAKEYKIFKEFKENVPFVTPSELSHIEQALEEIHETADQNVKTFFQDHKKILKKIFTKAKTSIDMFSSFKRYKNQRKNRKKRKKRRMIRKLTNQIMSQQNTQMYSTIEHGGDPQNVVEVAKVVAAVMSAGMSQGHPHTHGGQRHNQQQKPRSGQHKPGSGQQKTPFRTTQNQVKK